MSVDRGYIQIYTGNGKGKTTAAIGLAIRAIGAGRRVYMVQFMKNYPYSELEILRTLKPGLTLERFGNDKFVFRKKPPEQTLIDEMNRGLISAQNNMLSQKYDLIILDEILVSIYFKLFSVKQVIDFIDKKPEETELVLTGRYAPDEILDKADLVTDMAEVKHYYSQNVMARKGIEY